MVIIVAGLLFCSAAAHAGLIFVKEGGLVFIKMFNIDSSSSYIVTYQNGIQ